MLNIYIVHYTKLKDRKEFMDYQLSFRGHARDGVKYINKFDQEDLTDEIIESFYERSPSEYKRKAEGLWNRSDSEYRELNLSEISCTIKHFEALKEASQLKNNSLILEDDCCFSDTFFPELKNMMKNLPKDWDVVFLGSGCGNWFQRIKLNNSEEVKKNIFKVNHPATNCAECYLVNPKSAHKIYNNAFPFHMVSDWELAYIFYKLNMNIYWLYPSIAEQGSKNGMYKSTLDLGQR